MDLSVLELEQVTRMGGSKVDLGEDDSLHRFFFWRGWKGLFQFDLQDVSKKVWANLVEYQSILPFKGTKSLRPLVHIKVM